jgi:hypothetical protein
VLGARENLESGGGTVKGVVHPITAISGFFL